MQKKASQSNIGEISADAPVTSSRKGFEYLNELFIKLMVSILIIILNYFLSKFLVFKKKDNV